MHFEFLIEDQSGAKAMEILLPKLFRDKSTYKIHFYKGNGYVPKGLRPKTAAKKRILLDKLPRILRGYGTVPNLGYIIIICDLDDKKDAILNGYKNDSICGTWELLADAVCKGGSKALKQEGWQAIGKQKSVWAKEITPHMNVDSNISPSFNNMRLQLQRITEKPE